MGIVREILSSKNDFIRAFGSPSFTITAPSFRFFSLDYKPPRPFTGWRYVSRHCALTRVLRLKHPKNSTGRNQFADYHGPHIPIAVLVFRASQNQNPASSKKQIDHHSKLRPATLSTGKEKMTPIASVVMPYAWLTACIMTAFFSRLVRIMMISRSSWTETPKNLTGP